MVQQINQPIQTMLHKNVLLLSEIGTLKYYIVGLSKVEYAELKTPDMPLVANKNFVVDKEDCIVGGRRADATIESLNHFIRKGFMRDRQWWTNYSNGRRIFKEDDYRKYWTSPFGTKFGNYSIKDSFNTIMEQMKDFEYIVIVRKDVE